MKTPPGLESTGTALWDALHGEYDFRPDEIVMLTELCALADDLAHLRGMLTDREVTTTGSTGQEVIDPVRLEVHRVSARFESLAKTLSIPDDEPHVRRGLRSA